MLMATAAVTILVMMAVVFMMMLVTAAVLIVMMMLMMTVTTAAVLIVMMVLVMLMAAAMSVLMLMLVMMLMMLVTAAAVTILVIVMMGVLLQMRKLFGKCVLLLHGLTDLGACQLIPGCCDNDSVFVQRADQSNTVMELLFLHSGGTAEDNGFGSSDLVIIELAEILHKHFAFTGVCNRHKAAQLHIVLHGVFNSLYYIGKLADTGGLNEDPVGSILSDDLFQCLAKITNQRAADAAGIHFADGNAGLLQETAVNADLTKFIFDEYQLFTLVSFGDHFLDQGCLTGSKKTGVNINFRHKIRPSVQNFSEQYTTIFS